MRGAWTGCSVGLVMKEEDDRGDGFRWMVVEIMLLLSSIGHGWERGKIGVDDGFFENGVAVE